jgi:hypothetical protein
MHEPLIDKRAALAARGLGFRPSASPGDDYGDGSKPTKPVRRSRGVDRFLYPAGLLRRQRELNRTQLALAFALWRRARRDGGSFHVSMATLGRDIGGVAANHVAEEVSRLVALGFVEVVRKGCYRTGEATVFRVPEAPPERERE